LSDAGWTKAAIGDALETPYTTVTNWIDAARGYAFDDLPDAPPAPARPVSPKSKLGPDDPRHGTLNAYTNHNCRCDACRKANAEYNLESKRRRVAREDKPHGTKGGYYNWGCRCDDCSRAVGHKPERRARRKQIREQVRDLIPQGLPAVEIAVRTGASANYVRSQFAELGVQPPSPWQQEPTPEFTALAMFVGAENSEERNRLIRTVRRQGFTLDRIGGQIGLTRERVRQIVYGITTNRGPTRPTRAQLAAERDRYRLAWLSARRRAAYNGLKYEVKSALLRTVEAAHEKELVS
jgi:hypothetical protein